MSDFDLATITFAAFSSHLNKEFTVEYQGGSWPFTLITGSELDGAIPAGVKRRPFKLMFTSPPALNLGQGIMQFSNADFGSIGMFAVPVGLAEPAQGNNSPVLYQVCFN